MTPESYELEPKENIDKCLNCTLPPEYCTGEGDCANKKRVMRRTPRHLYGEILALIRKGHNQSYISRKLKVSASSLWQMMDRMRRDGMLTEEEERRVFPRSQAKK